MESARQQIAEPPNIRELESLRIARSAAPKRTSRLITGRDHRWSFSRCWPASATTSISDTLGTAARSADRDGHRQAGRTAGRGADRLRLRRHQHKYIMIGTKILGTDRAGADRGRAAGKDRRPAREDRRSRLPGATQSGVSRIATWPRPTSMLKQAQREASCANFTRSGVQVAGLASTTPRINWRWRKPISKRPKPRSHLPSSTSSQMLITSPINGVVLQEIS